LGDDLVKGVEVSKTLMPNMDADALGGTVNLTLKTADPGLHYNIWGNGGYNNLRNSYGNYKFALSGGDRFFNDHLGVLVQGNIEEKQLPSDQFTGGYASPTKSSVVANTFYINTSSATVTDDDVQRHRYGASLILDYASDLVDLKLLNVFDQKNDSTITRDNTSYFSNSSFEDDIYVNETKTTQETHSLQALFKLGGTELPISLSYTRGEQQVPNGQQFEFIQQLTGTPLSQNALVYGQPSRLINDMGVMNPANSILWNIIDSDTKLTDNSYDAKLDWKIPFRLSESFSGKISVGGKYHSVDRTSKDTVLSYDVQWGGSHGRIVELVNEFSSGENDFLKGANTNLTTGGIQGTYFVDPNYSRTSILGYPIGQQYDPYLLSYMENTIFPAWEAAYYVDGPGCFDQNYNDKEDTRAGYVMGEFNIGSNLTIVPGVRYQEEMTNIGAYHVRLNASNANGLDGPAPVWVNAKRDNPYWYPSVNIKYKATDNIQVLGAIYRSVSLPDYQEISPLVDLGDGGTLNLGNPLLKPATAYNYDVGASVFSDAIGLFTVDLFYKDITNLIYYLPNYFPFSPYPVVGTPAGFLADMPAKSYYDTTWDNSLNRSETAASIPVNDPSDAYLRGIEFSWQTHFWYLPGVLSGIVLDFNLTLMSSNQLYPYYKPLTTKLGAVDTLLYSTTPGALQDQPKAIYNAILGWDYKGFSIRYSVRYQQLTLQSMDTQFGLEDSYYDNVLLMDISAKQQIISNLYVFANATNINSHIDNYYYSHPTYVTPATTYPAGSLPTSQQTYGWNLQLGLTFYY
jgi:TonB-dependent receptor